MHTTKIILKDGREYTALHNGDFSGDVDIVAPAERVAVLRDRDDDMVSVTIPFEVMCELVGHYIINARVAELEQIDPGEFVRKLRRLWDD